MIIPKEINFNFTSKCSLGCNFCYVPFATSTVNGNECLKVLDKINDFSPVKITIVGGDPSSYSFLPDLLRRASEIAQKVHFDSNCYGFYAGKNSIRKVFDYVTIFGVPLDGHNTLIHGEMRGDSKHFGIVVNTLSKLFDLKANIQIHTVLNPINSDYLCDMAEIIKKCISKDGVYFSIGH